MTVCDNQLATIAERCLASSEYDNVMDGHVLSPWACIRFETFDETIKGDPITVGNYSSPGTNPPNVAAIKSLEFGQKDGFVFRVVIHDQQGGQFDKFVEHCVKNWSDLKINPASVKMKFQFGWTKAGCDIPLPLKSSPPFYAYMKSIETSYMEGKFIAEIEGDSIAIAIGQGGCEKIFGADGEQESMCLRDAIRELAMHPLIAPSVSQVEIIKLIKTKNGVVKKPCGFNEFDPSCGKFGGPKKSWPCNSFNKLAVIHSWIDDYSTDEGKAFRVAFDPTIKGERLIIFQDDPICKPKDTYCIARYIVNGSKHSPVLEFNPKMNWDFASLQSNGGGMSGENAVAIDQGNGQINNKTTGVVDCIEMSRDAQPGGGQMNQFITPQGMKDRHGRWAAQVSYNAQSKHMKANIAHLYHNDIEADLVIVGDPSFVNPWLLIDKTITIWFINPFFINKTGNGRCGEWLAEPIINSTLSSDAWRIQSVSHKIELGSYTTTLQLKLAKGDIGIPPNAVLPTQ